MDTMGRIGMGVLTAVVALGFTIFFWSLGRAHELEGVTPEYQAWASRVEIMEEARIRLPWTKCCNHAEIVHTRFAVSKIDGRDEWFYLSGREWKQIPRDIIHPEDEHAPDNQPTLFIYGEKETCFFLPQGGL